MKKLNFNYILTDQQGRVLKNGHIKYSISHFIYALYQKNYTTSPASMFWRSFNNALNNIGLVAFAFVNHTPQALNSSSRVGIIKLLHAFGYFAFYDITGTYPIFLRIKERVWLVDYQFNRAMSFHVKAPSKKITANYNNLYMASFGNANNFVDKDGTFTIKIVDPIGNNVVDDDAIKEHEEYCEYISRTLKKAKIFEFNDGSIVLKITIAKNPISELEDCSDKFSDGKVFVYVEEKLKVSDYLHFTNKENLVLSLHTASLIKLDDERFISLKNGVYRLFNDDEILKLKEMGFVVPDVSEYKQLQRIRKNTLTAKADRSSYTILTTTNCNARCPYCYEQGIEQISMSPATQKRIVDLICADQVKKVHISWFGGEPLLNTSAMDYITEQMNENGKEYSESIVTNGFLIDKYISNIAKWHISNVQITLDGIYEKYDNVKQFINEHNSFERIISNISLLLDNDVPVSIRLNFSDRNYLDILECIDYIYNKFGNNRILRVYAHHIFNESYHLNDGTNIYTIIFRKLMDCGYITSLEDLGLKARNYFCFVNNRSHKVIDPNGDMYLCEHITRNSSNKKVGNIVEGITNIENYNYWSSISYPYSECRKCKFIFLCQGGCKNNKDANDKSCCLPFIDSIDEIIISYYNRRRCDNGNNRTKRNQYD